MAIGADGRREVRGTAPVVLRLQLPSLWRQAVPYTLSGLPSTFASSVYSRQGPSVPWYERVGTTV